MTASVATITQRQRNAPGRPNHSRAGHAALRAALVTETRVAEALAQRSRGLVTLMERLTRRMLADAVDIPDARRRLDAFYGALHAALAAGETAPQGDLRTLAFATLGAFDMAAGPRILIEGPSLGLDPEAARVVSLALFDLASRSARFGALRVGEGRVALDWALVDGGGLRLTWRELGVPPGTERLRRGAGAALQALLADRFDGPLQQWETPSGLIAELAIPAWAIRVGGGPTPRRVLVAVEDVAVAVTLSALLMACGVADVGAVRTAAEVDEALATGEVDLIFVDATTADHLGSDLPPSVLVLNPGEEAGLVTDNAAVIWLPLGATVLAEVMAAALQAPRRSERID